MDWTPEEKLLLDALDEKHLDIMYMMDQMKKEKESSIAILKYLKEVLKLVPLENREEITKEITNYLLEQHRAEVIEAVNYLSHCIGLPKELRTVYELSFTRDKSINTNLKQMFIDLIGEHNTLALKTMQARDALKLLKGLIEDANKKQKGETKNETS